MQSTTETNRKEGRATIEEGIHQHLFIHGGIFPLECALHQEPNCGVYPHVQQVVVPDKPRAIRHLCLYFMDHYQCRIFTGII